MRIVAGTLRGKELVAPPGLVTRPSNVRLRAALFDMLMHASWGGREVMEGANVLDAFAGTGALGLEALSRGAARASFVEQDRAAFASLRQNIAACRVQERCRTILGDLFSQRFPQVYNLIFLDPPYEKDLVAKSIHYLTSRGVPAPGAIFVAETSRVEIVNTLGIVLAERVHGAGKLSILRLP